MKDLAEDVSLSSEAPVIEDNSHNVYIISNSNCIVDEGSTESLLEKAAKFIQDGELETTISKLLPNATYISTYGRMTKC